jgi:AraC-like DNA-binding protein
VEGLEILHLCRLGQTTYRTTGRHHHDHWQMEIILKGPVTLETEGSQELPANTLVLLPPGMPHTFLYPEKPTTWMSVKFRHPMASRGLVRQTPRGEVARALADFQNWCDEETPSRHKQRAIALSFAALLEMVLEGTEASDPGEQFRQRVRALARNPHGGYRSAGEIAGLLALTPNHLSAKFQTMTGTGLKDFLDGERAETARRHLVYETAPLGEVARLTGFDDLSSFSRFMFRVTGRRPGDIRRQGLI